MRRRNFLLTCVGAVAGLVGCGESLLGRTMAYHSEGEWWVVGVAGPVTITPPATGDIVTVSWNCRPLDRGELIAALEGMKRHTLNECGFDEKRNLGEYIQDVRHESGLF